MILGIVIGLVIGFVIGVVACFLWVDKKQSEWLREFNHPNKLDLSPRGD